MTASQTAGQVGSGPGVSAGSIQKSGEVGVPPTVIAAFRDVTTVPAQHHRDIARLVTHAILTALGQAPTFHPVITVSISIEY